ncbi:MAG: glycosyl hydrolase family 18 protein, partial [Firmicutes bacterium]|nr:glycosyl hydrolase family 18 protein [Bacillota bacterium]
VSSSSTPDFVPFVSGTLLKAKDSPTVYLVMNGTLHPIASAAVFSGMGYQWSQILTLPSLSPQWPTGSALTRAISYYPSGTLLKTADRATVYMVKDDALYPIASAAVFSAMGYQWNQILTLASLPSLPIESPLTSPQRAYPSGTIAGISGSSALYLIEKTEAIPTTAQQLQTWGFNLSSVITVPDLAGYATGGQISGTHSSSSPTPSSSGDPGTSRTVSGSSADPVAVSLAVDPSGTGYWILWSNGSVNALGSAASYPALSSAQLGDSAASALITLPGYSGYDIVARDGQAWHFGAMPALSSASGVSLSWTLEPKTLPAGSASSSATVSTSSTKISSSAPSTSSISTSSTLSSSGIESMAYGFFIDHPKNPQDSSLNDFEKHSQDFSFITPDWFFVDPSASGGWTVTSWATSSSTDINGENNVQYVTALAHQDKVGVMPSVAVYFNPANGPISSTSSQNALIAQIVQLVQQNHFDGITIDFENNGDITAQTSAQYTQFIQNLSSALHALGKKIMADVYPTPYPNTLYNYTAIAASIN